MSTSNENATDAGQPLELGWRPFITRAILIRSAIAAAVLGSVLTFVNQRGWISGNESLQVLPFVLVFLIPFAVVMAAQVAGIRQACLDADNPDALASPDGVISTMASHGIPARAVIIGLVFGSVNAILSVADEISRSGDLAALEVAPLGQAYVLPLVFGLLSQTIAYRRTRYRGAKAKPRHSTAL